MGLLHSDLLFHSHSLEYLEYKAKITKAQIYITFLRLLFPIFWAIMKGVQVEHERHLDTEI